MLDSASPPNVRAVGARQKKLLILLDSWRGIRSTIPVALLIHQLCLAVHSLSRTLSAQVSNNLRAQQLEQKDCLPLAPLAFQDSADSWNCANLPLI